MDNLINNTEHNKEEVSQHSDIKKEDVKLPLRTEIQKAFTVVKSDLGFTDKGLNVLRDVKLGIGFISQSLELDDQDFRKNIVKSIETLIEANHKEFTKSFKAYKKEQQDIKASFLTDYFTHCETQLEAENTSIKDGNKELKQAVIAQTLEAINNRDLQKEDLLILIELFASSKKSVAKKEALIKLIKANK